MTDTIVALATPRGKSGVAVIRISGEHYAEALSLLGVTSLLTPRYAHYRSLTNTTTKSLIDKVLVIYFPGPYSFTGEDVLEIHCHGGPVIISEIIGILLESSHIRYAEQGEFTRRALTNGKMDLFQAEALADIIDAETEKQKQVATSQLYGNSSSYISQLEDRLIEARAFCEAFIDFPDDDLPDDMFEQIDERIEAPLQSISALLSTAQHGKSIREGIKVAIVGVPNAGKSTLINALADRRVAITSEEPGTTRDAIEVKLDIQGVPFCIYDTAGLRDAMNAIEAEGVKIANERANEADLVLILIDPTQSTPLQQDIASRFVSRETIFIVNKIDLTSPDNEILSSFSGVFSGVVSRETIFLSAEQGVGVDILVRELERFAGSHAVESIQISRQRHINHLQEARVLLSQAKESGDLVIKAEYLTLACKELSLLTGKIQHEKILDALFGSFCIGK